MFTPHVWGGLWPVTQPGAGGPHASRAFSTSGRRMNGGEGGGGRLHGGVLTFIENGLDKGNSDYSGDKFLGHAFLELPKSS
jgi:hypothetical protein